MMRVLFSSEAEIVSLDIARIVCPMPWRRFRGHGNPLHDSYNSRVWVWTKLLLICTMSHAVNSEQLA